MTQPQSADVPSVLEVLMLYADSVTTEERGKVWVSSRLICGKCKKTYSWSAHTNTHTHTRVPLSHLPLHPLSSFVHMSTQSPAVERVYKDHVTLLSPALLVLTVPGTRAQHITHITGECPQHTTTYPTIAEGDRNLASLRPHVGNAFKNTHCVTYR